MVFVAGCSVATAANADAVKTNGFYVGFDSGYSQSHFRTTFKDGAAVIKTRSQHVKGLDNSLRFGYMANYNNYLVGGETSLGYASNEANITKTITVGTGQYTNHQNMERGWTSDLIAKFGMKFGKLSIYGSGGIAFAQFESELTATFVAPGNSTGDKRSHSETLHGLTFGGGFMFDVTERVAMKAEYRHTMLNKIGSRANVNNISVSAKSKPSTDAFVLGIAYYL